MWVLCGGCGFGEAFREGAYASRSLHQDLVVYHRHVLINSRVPLPPKPFTFSQIRDLLDPSTIRTSPEIWDSPSPPLHNNNNICNVSSPFRFTPNKKSTLVQQVSHSPPVNDSLHKSLARLGCESCHTPVKHRQYGASPLCHFSFSQSEE